MSPLVQEALASVLRWGLALAAGWLVQHGIWTQAAATMYVAAAALALVSLGWSVWQKYVARSKLMTALIMPAGRTENDVARKIASGIGVPSVTTAKDVVPLVP